MKRNYSSPPEPMRKRFFMGKKTQLKNVVASGVASQQKNARGDDRAL